MLRFPESLAIALILVSSLKGQTANSQTVQVTAVNGESWISHLDRDFGVTSMGKTGKLGPSPRDLENQSPGFEPATSFTASGSNVTIRGADLYRMNCQGCHGESGQGAPPEIGSVIDPVRATSVALTLDRMKQLGVDMKPAEAAALAKQARTAIVQRLENGGQDMPSFRHLSPLEVASLFAYLRQLAGIPGSEKNQITLEESHLRIGELIAKSTCHVCHSAVGTNPNPQQLLRGSIPPLSALTVRTTESGLVRKVIKGATISMGTPPVAYRGRMPVFYYLRPDEAADVYRYLESYPPAGSNQALAAARTNVPLMASDWQSPTDRDFHRNAPETDELSAGNIRLLFATGSFAFLLLIVGAWITIREFKRLSAEAQLSKLTARGTRLQIVPRVLDLPLEVRINHSAQPTERGKHKNSAAAQ